MDNPHEIIITTRKNPIARKVDFSELYTIKDDITTMMYLWNTNSYYVDVLCQIFIINGGRKMQFNLSNPCRVLYRKRNQITYKMDSLEGSTGDHNWLLGIEEIPLLNDKNTKKVLLIIESDGRFWQWANNL